MSGEREKKKTDDSLVCVIEWTSSTVRGVVYIRKCMHMCVCVCCDSHGQRRELM